MGTRLLRPRLKRTVDAVESAAGDIYILRPGADSDLVIEQPDRTARLLLAALDGTRTTAELEHEFGGERVRSALGDLAEAALLEDAADDDRTPARERERYDRQLRYFSDVATDGTPASEYHRRISQARVALLGVGGLGSWAAYALACCGVGELVLVDGDTVETSNFNRQILYRERDVGRAKTDAAAEALSAFNSACRLTQVPRRLDGVAAIREVIEGADFVVNAADWPAHDIERWTNQACVDARLPFITMSHSPPVARVGPLYVPGTTGCYACQETAYRESHPLYDELVEQHRGRPSPAPTLGPVCAFVGGQVALEVLHQVTGLCPPATLGVAHIYDLRTMGVTREPVPHLPACAVCGSS
ncbi:MAG: sulfur-carrier protein adenylyltransferase/sulfurtransferase [Thermoleophilaceae bacterium]|nr:sulfur-carrier protein adenylyltransferase/sulfurtransferase [Thermoleophilaceae bacterium]